MATLSLKELLAKQPPTTSGIHEAVALHNESVFQNLRGILPMFLGKRKTGSFINLALPNRVTESSEALMQSLSDLIWVYDLCVISFVSAIRMQTEEEEEPNLKALLITADNARSYFQLPWNLSFDSESNISSFERSNVFAQIIPSEVWQQIFAHKISPEAKTLSYDRLEERFGGPENIPSL